MNPTIEIKLTLEKYDSERKEYNAITSDGKNILCDPFVGCIAPFHNHPNPETLLGNYHFDGHYHGTFPECFLPTSIIRPYTPWKVITNDHDLPNKVSNIWVYDGYAVFLALYDDGDFYVGGIMCKGITHYQFPIKPEKPQP